MKRLICTVLAFVIFFGICGIIAPEVNNIYKLEEAASFAEQVDTLVKHYESRQDTQNRLIVNSNKIKESYGAVKVIKAHGFQVMQFDSYEKAENAKNSIEKLGIACDRDDFAYVQAVKKAKSTKDLWASQTTQSDVTMQYLASTGKKFNDVTVAVIDTGINDKHEAFEGRLIECNKNFSSSGTMNSSFDDSGHGTNVAGVIALNTLDNVKIKPYKTFDNEGKCTNSQIIATLNYILSEKKLPDIINMSFSVQSITSSVTRDSLTRNLISKGVTIVTSAGNNGVNAKYYYPANISEVITVSASDKKNEKADFSNYGKCIDIAAPGTGVYTTELDGTYSYENGTSFSAPFVSSAAATLIMQKSGLSCADVEKAICDEAVPVYIENFQVEWCGAGIVNFSGLICGEKASAPSFGTPQGKYNEPFKLEIKGDSNEKIMYTTDNTVPTSKNGLEYTKPIDIDKSTHIIAVAYDDMKKSKYVASTYELVYEGSDDDFDITQDGVITSYNGDKTSITVPSQIDGITVTAIGDNVFNGSDIKNITLPYSVTSIGVSAFADSKISSISGKCVTTLDNGAFENCSSLVTLDTPAIEYIGNRCFKNCNKLTSIGFSQNVKEIGVGAFAFTGLSTADFPNASIGSSTFEGSNVVVAKINKAENLERTFCECELLSSLTAPNLKNIGNFSFYNCKSLGNINLNNVQSVSNYAFANSVIKTADLPNCTFLGNAVFNKCDDLVSVNIPLVTKIMPEEFNYCTSLKKINMPNVEAFDDISKEYFTDCIALEGLYLPKSVNLPSISWTSSVQSSMLFGKKAQLSYIFAPKASKVSNSEDLPFMFKCSKLKYAFLTSAKSLDYIDNVDGCVLYLGSKAAKLPDNPDCKKITVIAPNSSYALNWAKKNGLNYVESSALSCVSISSKEIGYEALGDSYTLPSNFVKSLWDVSLVNTSKSDETVSALLDFNNDDTVNAKDYAIINKQ